jgi:flagellar basal body-associated protein FliL
MSVKEARALKSKRLLAMATVLAMALCVTLAACSNEEPEPTETEEVYDYNTIPYAAGDFVTNVRDSGKMLSSTIKIDLISQKLADILAEKEYVAQDVINRQLSQLTEQDLNTANIQDTAAASLVDALNEAFNTKGFYKVYFTRFIVAGQ